jgi:hypothetical protein
MQLPMTEPGEAAAQPDVVADTLGDEIRVYRR